MSLGTPCRPWWDPRAGFLRELFEGGVPRGACGFLALAAAAACGVGDDVSEAPGLVVRDSSSIEILENRTAVWDDGQPWEVADTPSVTLAPESADSAHLIWKVRGAARLGDGRLAVLSGGARQLLVFDRTGSIVRVIGGPGEGPGEFTSPTHLQRLPGDTLVVWERFYGPRTFFDTTGQVIRTVQVDRMEVVEKLGHELRSENLTPLPDGSFVSHVAPSRPRAARPPAGEPFRTPIGYALLRHDRARVLGAVGRYHGVEVVYPEAGRASFPAFREFAPRSSITGGGNPLRIFVSDGEHFQVDVFDGRGKLRRIIRRTTDPVPITPQRRLEARERIMAWNNVDEDGREAWVRRFDRLPPQTHHPAVHDLFVDREGYLWAAHTGEGWNVFAPSGRWLGTLRIPLERLYDVGSDFVVGWTFDESLRERIVEYRLRRVP